MPCFDTGASFGNVKLYPRFLSARIILRIFRCAFRTRRFRLRTLLRAFRNFLRFFRVRRCFTFLINRRTRCFQLCRCLMYLRLRFRHERNRLRSLAMIFRFLRGNFAIILRSRVVNPLISFGVRIFLRSALMRRRNSRSCFRNFSNKRCLVSKLPLARRIRFMMA